MSRNAANRETIKISNSRVNPSPTSRMSGITVIEENMKGLFMLPESKESICVPQSEVQTAESLMLFVTFT